MNYIFFIFSFHNIDFLHIINHSKNQKILIKYIKIDDDLLLLYCLILIIQ